MADLFWNAEMLDLRVVEHFVNRVDRRVGNIVGVESEQPICARLRTKLLAQNVDNLAMTVGALFAGGEARVADQAIELSGLKQPFSSLVMPRQMNHERFAVAIEHTVNASFGKKLARHGLGAVQVMRHLGFDEG